MTVTYFKRYKMEIELVHARPVPPLPPGYEFVPWHDSLCEMHAQVKFHCFHDEIDAIVFPSLSQRDGCYYLMQEIRQRAGFIPQATWLIASEQGYCGTVQGIRDRAGFGAIQNLGVSPYHRGHGLGAALLLKALEGFRRAGLGKALLEVTAENEGAVRLYRRLGFRCRKTLYKAVDVRDSALVAAGTGVMS
jgi:GNAT superfamily N-acetyltransferase